MDNDFLDIRVFFSKTGRAKYISHLDLYRTVQRAIKRAKLDVWETQGFNSHIYLTFALPLSLGIEGINESMDFRLVTEIPFEEVHSRFNAALPAEINILSVNTPKMKHTEIKNAEYVINTDCDKNKFREFLKLEKIEIEKKTKKKGKNIIDLKQYLNNVTVDDDSITIVLPAGTDFNINPQLVIEAYKKFNIADSHCLFLIARTKISNEHGNTFN